MKSHIVQMYRKLINTLLYSFAVIFFGCGTASEKVFVQDIKGKQELNSDQIWLSHEHLLVNFIGADSIQFTEFDRDKVVKEVAPYVEELKKNSISYFVDATPNYLGRDVLLLEKIANETGIRILTNTGLYGARNNKFIPAYVKSMTAQNLSKMWIDEFINGIDGTEIRPGFIKIGVDSSSELDEIQTKLVKAAALTHLTTGLTIASHTGKSVGLWPQLHILHELGVSTEAFIWVHAQSEKNHENYLKAAKLGCWISLDGLGWELENHIEKIVFAKTNGFLDRILISHDAGWYDPNKEIQSITPYTAIFEKLYPALKLRGFTDDEFNLLISKNPSKAFAIKIRKQVSN